MAGEEMMALEVKHGEQAIRFAEGVSFGAHRSVAGELVFQTGMVGYPESITDPSYRGQILVITFPLVGNYGVPSREDRDAILQDLPAHFEASEIHIAGLIVASYSGEDYSHYLAKSSLGTWLKEQNVPAVYGVDTRALTKRIREQGSMLGRLLMQTGTRRMAASNGAATPSGMMTPSGLATPALANGHANGLSVPGINGYFGGKTKEVPVYEEIDWYNPNIRNLVADGELAAPYPLRRRSNLIVVNSLNLQTKDLLPKSVRCVEAPVRSSRACRLCRCRAQVQPAALPHPARRRGRSGAMGLRLSKACWQGVRRSVHLERTW